MPVEPTHAPPRNVHSPPARVRLQYTVKFEVALTPERRDSFLVTVREAKAPIAARRFKELVNTHFFTGWPPRPAPHPNPTPNPKPKPKPKPTPTPNPNANANPNPNPNAGPKQEEAPPTIDEHTGLGMWSVVEPEPEPEVDPDSAAGRAEMGEP